MVSNDQVFQMPVIYVMLFGYKNESSAAVAR